MKQSFTTSALLAPATAVVVGIDRSATPGPIAIR